MDIQMALTIFGILQVIYEFWTRYTEVDARCSDLRRTLEELDSKAKDMEQQAAHEEKPGKKRKRVIKAYCDQVKRYKASADKGLRKIQEGSWKVKHMTWMPYIERHQKEGDELLKKGQELLQKGLTNNQIRTRGEKLPLGDHYIGQSTGKLMKSALQGIKSYNSVRCIGIYGSSGSGKTSLMKYLHNDIYEDESFSSVFWATAPEVESDSREYNKVVQRSIADGMWIGDDFDNFHSEATRAGRIMARLEESREGRIVLFLDDVKEEFPANELLGLPSPNCVLVFTTWSKDICNRMHCDLILEMNLLNKEEAKEMFLYEVRHRARDNNPPRVDSKQEQRIHKVAVQVANQCAGMPLVITSIARIMGGSKDIREWRNRLNELKGTISTIHEDEEGKILEQLKFGYNCLKDRKVQVCFLEAARLLVNDSLVSKEKIIEKWKRSGLIGRDRQGKAIDDEGHTILNQLERMCLIQVGPDRLGVTMNKWIWKMAEKIKTVENN